jgi:hypothetical protein
MNSNMRSARVLESKVADRYRAQGFEVVLEPQPKDLPFDLGAYRPDIIARKKTGEGYLIEVKSTASRAPIDRYRDIAEQVAEHDGWRYLLVTGEDEVPGEPTPEGELLAWEQIVNRKTQAERLLSMGAVEGAFLSLWGVIEAALRRRAKEVAIPIDLLPTPSLINHLYSQGELSIEQFDEVKALQGIRNRLVHGYQTPDIAEPAEQLQQLAGELIAAWRRHCS